MHVVVIGAGVVGASSALALVERGLAVTLVDRHSAAGLETSYANGAAITPGHAEPWNSPGIARRLLGAGGGEPFRIHPRALPGLVPWGVRFLAQSRHGRYFANARHNTRLAVYSRRCLARLRERHGLEYDQFTDGSLELYFDRAGLDAALALRRDIGDPDVEIRKLGVDEVVAMEPALAPIAGRLVGAMFQPSHESGDASEFSREVARRAESLGAQLRFETTVERIAAGAGQPVGVHTSSGVIKADAVVVSAGCASPALLRPLGLKLPIYPVKGYSATLTLAEPERAPAVPLLDLEHRIVTARLGNRLRMAGLADFEGHDRSIHADRLAILIEGACALLPELAETIRNGEPEAWTGLRPMTPDGPPLLGTSRIPGVYLNTGHGSLGWTQAAGSAEIIAEIITGNAPAIDLTGLDPARWQL